MLSSKGIPTSSIDSFLQEDVWQIDLLRTELQVTLLEYDRAMKEDVSKKNAADHEARTSALKTTLDTKGRDLRNLIANAKSNRDEWQARQYDLPQSPPDVDAEPPFIEPVRFSPKSKELKLDLPTFEGDMASFPTWRFDVLQHIKVRPSTMDTDWKKITLFGSAMRSHAKLWFQLYIGQRDEDALLPTDLVSAEELKIRNNEFSSFMDALDLKFKDPLLISNAQVWVTTASQGSMLFDDYVTLFLTNVLRARYNADHQIMRFIESINPSIRRMWRPKDNTMPLSLAACISDIRHCIQTNAILNPPTPRHNVGPNLSGSQDFSLPRHGITNSHLLTSSKVWDDPSKPGPFTVNPTTPTYKVRESKGWCLRCGMSSHSTEKCRIYPTTLSNAENYETGKRKVAAYKNQNTLSSARVHVSSMKENEGAPSTPVINSTQIDSDDFYFDGLSGINQTMRPYAPHFMIPFSVAKVDSAELITGKALIDSGASKSYMSRDFAVLHGIEMVKLVHPVKVILADGKQQQSITHTTTPLAFTINQHSETLVAGIFNTKSYDVILGLNWLTFHSPSIDWELRTIKFISYICQNPRKPHQVPERILLPAEPTLGVQTVPGTASIIVNQLPQTLSVPTPVKHQLPPPSWPASKFPNLFNRRKGLPPRRPGYDFDPILRDDMPPPKNRPLFRLSKSHRELTEAFVREGLADGTLTKSQSPFAANLFFIERDGKNRPCIDYRDLNACTMANVKELVQQMAGADWYCKLDLKKAYNQIRVKEGSQPKLAFKCHVGTFQPEVMPFGPKNAPSVMQRYVHDKFGKFIEDGRVVNLLDDFYIRTVGTIPDHQLNIEEILRVMEVEILVLADDKSIWFAKEIPMMGFIVNKYGYRKDMSRLGALLDYGTPSTPKHVRSFVGMANFYNAFIPNLSTTAKPLHDLTAKDVRFSWDQQHEKAFEKIKELVKADVFLTFPDFTKPFYISFDASELGIGATLQQMSDKGQLRPLEFYSRKWSTTEWNYSVPDKELYALILSLQHWYHWLVGATEIICYTDHKSLRDFSKTQLLKPRHARWALTLEEFRSRLKIRWIPGSRNIVADALSRDPRFQLSAAEA
ncbi:hypothetical protein SeLEV6574_g08257, partial [Synchytrium endobioticum]